MNTNTDKMGKSEDTHTTRIPKPKLKTVPKISKPTIPTGSTETQEAKPVVNPLKTAAKKEKATDTVHLKVVKDIKPTPAATQTVKLRPSNATSAAPMTPPRPAAVPVSQKAAAEKVAAPTAEKTATMEEAAKAPVKAPAAPTAEKTATMEVPAQATEKPQVLRAAETPATQKTVKLKSAPAAGPKMKAAAPKMKAPSPQDKTVKMKAVPDAATGAEKTARKVTPPMPFEEELEEPGVLMTILNLASVAAVATGLFFAYQSMVALELF